MKSRHLFCIGIASTMLLVAGCESSSDHSDDDTGSNGGATPGAATGRSGSLGLPAGTQWIDGRNIEHWPETMKLYDATIHYGRHQVTVKYTRLQEIPAWNVSGDPNNVHNVNGSIWLVREFEGQWYIGTFEYLRVGQETKEFLEWAPQYKFTPQQGDRIGFMVSTLARVENGTVSGGQVYRERSNIHWMNFGD